MTKNGKILLGGCIAIVVIAVAIVAGIAAYIGAHKGELLARGKKMRDDGISAGRFLSEPQCVDRALKMYGGDRGIAGGIRSRIWMAGCLESSMPYEGFCEGVPPESEIARTVAWRVSQCNEHGLRGDGGCPNVVAEVQRYCAGTARLSKKPR